MENELHPLLRIESVHMGKSRAREYVEYLAGVVGIPVPSHEDYSNDLTVKLNGGDFRLNFADCVRDTQENGVPRHLQFLVDSQDAYLAPTIEIAMSTPPTGLSIGMSGTVGQFTNSVTAPGYVESPERAIADDILYFRQQCCASSTLDRAKECARYYRNYLQSSISLVDCFIFRYARFVREKIPDFSAFSNLIVLDSLAGIEKRLRAWMQTFATGNLNDYDKTTEWGQFQEIRRLRNTIVHPSEPVTVYSYRAMATSLNLCRKGIGGLLFRFRDYSKSNPRLGFIQKLTTAPNISFSP